MFFNFWQIIKTIFQFIFTHWLFFFAVIILVIVGIILSHFTRSKPLKYQYKFKRSVMTDSEFRFFKLLKNIMQEHYDIFPQIHLDAILDGKVYGQNWFGAFRHINEKSVDFVLCDKNDGVPVLAIELDDRSHLREDRIIRDEEVERIFQEIKLPLLRIKDEHTFEHSYTPQGISTQIFNILKK